MIYQLISVLLLSGLTLISVSHAQHSDRGMVDGQVISQIENEADEENTSEDDEPECD